MTVRLQCIAHIVPATISSFCVVSMWFMIFPQNVSLEIYSHSTQAEQGDREAGPKIEIHISPPIPCFIYLHISGDLTEITSWWKQMQGGEIYPSPWPVRWRGLDLHQFIILPFPGKSQIWGSSGAHGLPGDCSDKTPPGLPIGCWAILMDCRCAVCSHCSPRRNGYWQWLCVCGVKCFLIRSFSGLWILCFHTENPQH